MGIIRSIGETFKQMTWKEHLVYWILPVLVSWILAIMYFAGPAWMQNITAHAYNREFGLLENLENTLLLGVIILSYILLKNARHFIVRIIYLLCLLTSVFMLLEEIDYGFHVWNYFQGIHPQQDTVIRNIHNQGKNTIKILMWIGYAIILLFILVMPHLNRKNFPTWFKNFVPSVKLHFTVLTLPFISRFPHFLNKKDFDTNMSLYHNLSEFEEFAIYYIFFLFFYEMKKKQEKQKNNENRLAGT